MERHGFVTTQDAREMGIPPVELRKLTGRGGLSSVAYGLYRFRDIPATEVDQYLEAVLRVGEGAYLIADSVLAMHHLGHVNPPKIKVGTPHRVRSKLPGYIRVWHHPVPTTDLTQYNGIPSTTVARALRDCVGIVMLERLQDSLRQATELGLVTRGEASTVRTDLRRGSAWSI